MQGKEEKGSAEGNLCRRQIQNTCPGREYVEPINCLFIVCYMFVFLFFSIFLSFCLAESGVISHCAEETTQISLSHSQHHNHCYCPSHGLVKLLARQKGQVSKGKPRLNRTEPKGSTHNFILRLSHFTLIIRPFPQRLRLVNNFALFPSLSPNYGISYHCPQPVISIAHLPISQSANLPICQFSSFC